METSGASKAVVGFLQRFQSDQARVVDGFKIMSVNLALVWFTAVVGSAYLFGCVGLEVWFVLFVWPEKGWANAESWFIATMIAVGAWLGFFMIYNVFFRTLRWNEDSVIYWTLFRGTHVIPWTDIDAYCDGVWVSSYLRCRRIGKIKVGNHRDGYRELIKELEFRGIEQLICA